MISGFLALVSVSSFMFACGELMHFRFRLLFHFLSMFVPVMPSGLIWAAVFHVVPPIPAPFLCLYRLFPSFMFGAAKLLHTALHFHVRIGYRLHSPVFGCSSMCCISGLISGFVGVLVTIIFGFMCSCILDAFPTFRCQFCLLFGVCTGNFRFHFR